MRFLLFFDPADEQTDQSILFSSLPFVSTYSSDCLVCCGVSCFSQNNSFSLVYYPSVPSYSDFIPHTLHSVERSELTIRLPSLFKHLHPHLNCSAHLSPTDPTHFSYFECLVFSNSNCPPPHAGTFTSSHSSRVWTAAFRPFAFF